MQAVLDKVDARELIDLASALIRIPSFKTEETAVALYLDRFFRERGYDVDLQEIEPGRFQTIATLRGSGGGASLMAQRSARRMAINPTSAVPLPCGWVTVFPGWRSSSSGAMVINSRSFVSDPSQMIQPWFLNTNPLQLVVILVLV